MDERPEVTTERTRDFERFVTFVDAVVAIAITLLVLPLVDVANALRGGSVAHLLSAHRVEIGGFLLSFVVIAALWLSQHRVVRTVVAHDATVVRLMLAWTLTIVVLPFPTALVAQSGHQAATKIFYIGTMALSSAVLAVLGWAIGRNPAIRDSEDKPDWPQAAGTTVGFLVALGISLAVPATSYWPLLLLLVTGRAVDLIRRLGHRAQRDRRGRRPVSRPEG